MEKEALWGDLGVGSFKPRSKEAVQYVNYKTALPNLDVALSNWPSM